MCYLLSKSLLTPDVNLINLNLCVISICQADTMKALGGHNVNESVRRMYHRVATDEVWSQYCLKGRNEQKKALCKLSLYDTVYRELNRSLRLIEKCSA